MAFRLGLGQGVCRLAVYKCLVAAQWAGIDMLTVRLGRSGASLVGRGLPTLLHGRVEVVGEHAICRYLGAVDAKKKLAESLEGNDWVELDEKVARKHQTLADVEARLSKRTNQTAMLGAAPGGGLGVADICIGCTLAMAKANGAVLGPASESWLQHLMSAHPEFRDCLSLSGDVTSKFSGTLKEIRGEQAASVMGLLNEAVDQVMDRLLPPGTDLLSGVSDSNRKAGKPGQIVHDFQINSAMTLQRALAGAGVTCKTPKDAAVLIEQEVGKVQGVFAGENRVVDRMEIAGPGFINLYLDEGFVTSRVIKIVEAGKLEPYSVAPRTVAVDFSSPNVAKEMHVGHLRSTIIGETICRTLSFVGHNVLRINHIGDWGTQFGMLLTYMRDTHPDFLQNPPNISDLGAFYKSAKKAFDDSEDFKDRSRLEVVKLQGGDVDALAAWRQFLSISEEALFQVYKRLGVTFPDGLCGESFYNDKIPAIVDEFVQKGLAQREELGVYVHTPSSPPPLFLVKRDGGYGYDSTDLAALKYRVYDLKADWIIYVVDAGQSQHFDQLFEASAMANWAKNVRLDHVKFGVVCGQDGKRYRTRSGESVRLVDLLDEAKNRMKTDLLERVAAGKSPVPPEEIDHAAGVLGYGAVKYFDLKSTREKDYIFSYDAMLASDGDTAVYLIYSYARICSIESKVAECMGAETADIINAAIASKKVRFSRDRPAEWLLANALISFPDSLERATNSLQPHLLCSYSYELAVNFAKFYNSHQLLVPTGDNLRTLDPEMGASWLVLLRAVKIALKDSLNLLSIDTLERI